MASKEDEDSFMNSDKVVSIIDLLTKFKIKLWLMSDLSSAEQASSTEVNNFSSDNQNMLLFSQFILNW